MEPTGLDGSPVSSAAAPPSHRQAVGLRGERVATHLLNPERGPRIGLTTEGRTSFGTIAIVSCPGKGECVIIYINTVP